MTDFEKSKYRFVLSNAAWGIFYLAWAYGHIQRFPSASGVLRLTEILLITQGSLLAFFFIFRQRPKATSWHFGDVITSLLGTFAPFLFIPTDAVEPKIVGIILQMIGSSLCVLSLVSLNRSWGVLPAVRIIKVNGMYQLVRHPVYASYLIFNTGYLINHPSFYNICVGVFCFLSQILRIYSEERFLVSDPLYKNYQQKVRWRLIPFIF